MRRFINCDMVSRVPGLLALAVACLMTSGSFAQDELDEAWIEEAKIAITELHAHAEALQEQGRLEEAKEYLQKANAIKAKLEDKLAAEKKKRLKQEGKKETDYEAMHKELEKTIEGLEHGIVALKKLNQPNLAEELNAIANELREKNQQLRVLNEDIAKIERSIEKDEKLLESKRKSDKEADKERIQVMKYAVPILKEHGREDTIELLERAMHARQMKLAGREDEEAMEILENYPGIGVEIEILHYASRLWKEAGNGDSAQALAELAGQLSKEMKKQKDQPRRERDSDHRESAERDRSKKVDLHYSRPTTDRELNAARAHLKIFEHALHGLMEAEKKDAADILRRAIQARKIVASGDMNSDEAREVLAKAPPIAHEIELLAFAGDIWDDFGHETKAGQCKELAEHLKAKWRAENEPASSREAEAKEEKARERNLAEQNRELREYVKKLEAQIKELQVALDRAKRDR